MPKLTLEYGDIAHEFQQVHDVMLSMYDKNFYNKDVQRAKQIENILRKIKSVNIIDNDTNNLESAFDKQCYEIADQALKNIQTVSGSKKLYAKNLFMTSHGRGYELGKSMGVDDIVEAELASVLQALQSFAFEDIKIDNLDFLTNTTGRVKGNLETNAQKLITNITEDTIVKTVKKVQKTNFRNKPYQQIAAKLKDTQAKSIKTDVVSYDVELSAILKPEWKQFSVFSGARFTVKNYIPKRKNNVAVQIHFGASNPYKSVIAQLNYLGYDFDQSQHIFFHSLRSWMKSQTKAVEIHIPHLRFAYELEGNGLYDEQGVSISGADFLIVNDPISSEIYVRSTKAMIANALKSEVQSSMPFTSSQYIMYDDIIKGRI